MKRIVKLSESRQKELVSESIKEIANANINEEDFSQFIPERNEEDEESVQFYEKLGDCCYRGLDCFNEALELLDSPYGRDNEESLKIITKNIKNICDRINKIWDEEHDD